jgi:hypothetical protein
MAADVDVQMPGIIVPDPIASGGSVRGSYWAQTARALNYLLGGTSRALIPWCHVENSDAGACTLRFKIWPSYQATHRIWMVRLYGTAAESFTFTDPSSGTSDVFVSGTTTLGHVETISSRTDAETSIALTYTATDDTQVLAIACFEIGRPSLALNTSDYGIDVGTFRGGAPIFEATGLSFGALHDSLEEARGFRRKLFDWAGARPFDALEINSGSPTALLSYDLPCLDRQLYRNETQVEITIWIYTRSSSGTTGNVVFTLTNGDSVTISVPASDAGTWRSGTVSVDAEDLSTSDGRRSNRFDQCAVTGVRTGGSGSVFIDAISGVGRAT